MTQESSRPQPGFHALEPANNTLRMAALSAALFVILLLPAVWNGFPFVMEDSIGYSGQGVGWMRSKTAAVAVAPLYAHVGYWALPLVNAALTAGAWLALSVSFRLGNAAFLALPLSILALQPLYASAVLVDIWFFAAIVLAIVAMIHASPLLALLSGIALTAHGSGVILFAALAIGAALLFRNARFLIMAGLTLATAFIVNFALDLRHHPDMPRLQNTFVASRLFSVYPELLTRECQRSGETLLCDHAITVEALRQRPENAGRRDFFWEMAFRSDPPIDLLRFEREHALPIIKDAIGYKPWELTGLIALDFASFYLPDTKLDFPAALHEPMPSPYEASRQAAGTMETAKTRMLATTSRYLLYLAVIAAVATGWRRANADTRRWIVLLLATCLANDALFAILSGPPDRYHHRILGLLAAAAVLAVGAPARARPPSSD